MNENFTAALEQSGFSMYSLARVTGIPYTTINELKNQKNDINRCPAETVFKIAEALQVPAESILNPIIYFTNIQGTYRGIHYTWICNECTELVFDYKGQKVTVSMGKILDVRRFRRLYRYFAEFAILDHIKKEEWEEAQDKLAERFS